MKTHQHQQGGSGRGRIGDLALGLGACLFIALPALAWGGANSGSGTGGGSGPGGGAGNNLAAGGDETVGTLPIVGGGRIDLPLLRQWRGTSPAFVLEGQPEELALLVQGARGRGFATYEIVDPVTGRARLAFHGDVFVVLDRELASTLSIEFGVFVPAAFGSGRASLAWGTGAARQFLLRPGFLPLPLASASADHALEMAPLRIRTGNAVGVHSAHTVAAVDSHLILRQTD
jgi:hypothetical protein